MLCEPRLTPPEVPDAPKILGRCAYCGEDILRFADECVEWYQIGGISLHEGYCLRRYVYLNFCRRSDEEWQTES